MGWGMHLQGVAPVPQWLTDLALKPESHHVLPLQKFSTVVTTSVPLCLWVKNITAVLWRIGGLVVE
jgi:hypothetical protein